MRRYRVTLTAAEREELGRRLARGRADVRKLRHARVLLQADEAEGSPARTDERVAEAAGVALATVRRLRRRLVEEGFAAALSPYRKGGRIYGRKLDGGQEAHLIALACSAPPDGRGRWSLRLLARRMVELEYADTLSHETVRQALKKTSSSRIRGRCGASRRSSRPSSSTAWRMCRKSTSGRSIRIVRSYAWTRPASD